MEQTVAGCEAILEGKFDNRDEGALYMIGVDRGGESVSLDLEIIAPDRVIAHGRVVGAAGGGRERPVRDLAGPREIS